MIKSVFKNSDDDYYSEDKRENFNEFLNLDFENDLLDYSLDNTNDFYSYSDTELYFLNSLLNNNFDPNQIELVDLILI